MPSQQGSYTGGMNVAVVRIVLEGIRSKKTKGLANALSSSTFFIFIF